MLGLRVHTQTLPLLVSYFPSLGLFHQLQNGDKNSIYLIGCVRIKMSLFTYSALEQGLACGKHHVKVMLIGSIVMKSHRTLQTQ